MIIMRMMEQDMNIKDAVKVAFMGKPQPIEAIECLIHCKNSNLYIYIGNENCIIEKRLSVASFM